MEWGTTLLHPVAYLEGLCLPVAFEWIFVDEVVGAGRCRDGTHSCFVASLAGQDDSIILHLFYLT
jgi:hypothetical protein